jgi:hypothetical protein
MTTGKAYHTLYMDGEAALHLRFGNEMESKEYCNDMMFSKDGAASFSGFQTARQTPKLSVEAMEATEEWLSIVSQVEEKWKPCRSVVTARKDFFLRAEIA